MKNIKLIIGLLFLGTAVMFTSCDPDDLDDDVTTFLFDCPDLQADFGDSCTTPNGNEVGTIDQDCNCVFETEYDCPEAEANFGDFCTTADGAVGLIDQDCNCEGSQFDCPEIELNVGDSCRLNPQSVEWGIITQNCFCDPINSTFDCPEWQANVGGFCYDNGYGTLDEDCNCIVEYDCPETQANIGDACTSADGYPGEIDQDCNCIAFDFDCLELQLNVGDLCRVDPAGTIFGTVNEDCECIEDTTVYDCENWELNFGDPCYYGQNQLGAINEDCECGEASSDFDCPEVELNVGDPCLLNPATQEMGTVNDNCACS